MKEILWRLKEGWQLVQALTSQLRFIVVAIWSELVEKRYRTGKPRQKEEKGYDENVWYDEKCNQQRVSVSVWETGLWWSRMKTVWHCRESLEREKWWDRIVQAIDIFIRGAALILAGLYDERGTREDLFAEAW